MYNLKYKCFFHSYKLLKIFQGIIQSLFNGNWNNTMVYQKVQKKKSEEKVKLRPKI